jgi:hypothetical protein
MVFILVLSAGRAAVVIVVIQQVAADLGPGERRQTLVMVSTGITRQ